MPESSLELVPLAETTPLARRSIAALAQAAPVPQLIDALGQALEDDHLRAATTLALAVAAAGGEIPARFVIRLAPDLDGMEFLPPIAANVEGDRLQALLDIVSTDRLSWEREGLILFLAARLLDGAEPPTLLTARLRSLLREPLGPEAAIIAGLAAAALNDPEVDAVAGSARLVATFDGAKRMAESMWELFTTPVLDMLPEQEVAPRGPVVTVMRAQPKVGRNDPCPCGSGRKYKKCCADKEPVATAPRSLVDQFHEVGPRAPRVLQQLFDNMRPADLERLAPEELTTLQLIQAIRRLSSHHRWEAAERFMDALAGRRDLPFDDSPDGHRADLAYAALDAGELELAERQMALANPDERDQVIFGLRLALARRSPDALERLEALLREAHANDRSLVVDCAHALLHHTPALGILAARGAIGTDRLLDSEELLDSIGRARDVLGLPAEEPWEEVFDVLVEAYFGEGEGDEEKQDHGAEVTHLRDRLREAGDRTRRLGEELARRERELEAVSGERAKLAATVEAHIDREDRRRVAELEQERQHLRAKIAELKGEVAEGVAQRAELRRELARSADERNRIVNVTPDRARDESAADDEEGEAVESRPRRILIPQYSTAATRSLNAVPARVAADALQEAARLAGGDAHAWSGAKHMQRAHEILSVRVGRTWRLLFRMTDERLEVLDLVHRRELDNAIARLSRA